MGVVKPLFVKGSVQKILCEASDQGLTEVLLIGKKPNGSYHIAASEVENMVGFIGMLDLLKHDSLMAIYEQWE